MYTCTCIHITLNPTYKTYPQVCEGEMPLLIDLAKQQSKSAGSETQASDYITANMGYNGHCDCYGGFLILGAYKTNNFLQVAKYKAVACYYWHRSAPGACFASRVSRDKTTLHGVSGYCK